MLQRTPRSNDKDIRTALHPGGAKMGKADERRRKSGFIWRSRDSLDIYGMMASTCHNLPHQTFIKTLPAGSGKYSRSVCPHHFSTSSQDQYDLTLRIVDQRACLAQGHRLLMPSVHANYFGTWISRLQRVVRIRCFIRWYIPSTVS